MCVCLLVLFYTCKILFYIILFYSHTIICEKTNFVIQEVPSELVSPDVVDDEEQAKPEEVAEEIL